MTAQHDKHLVMRIAGHNFVMPINPEEISYSDPARVTVTYTLGDAWVDHWGRAIGEITIKGTTGWKGGLKENAPEIEKLRRDGFLAYHAMLLAWAHYLGRRGHTRFDVFIETDHRAFRVTPKTLQTSRTSQKPLLFQYSWSMYILQDLTRRPPGTDPDRGAIDPVWSALHRTLRTLPLLPPPPPVMLHYVWPEPGGGSIGPTPAGITGGPSQNAEAQFMAFVRTVSPGLDPVGLARLNRVRTFGMLPAGFVVKVPVVSRGGVGVAAQKKDPTQPAPPPDPAEPPPGITGRTQGGME